MSLLDFANGSLQTIATILVGAGGYTIYSGGKEHLLEGIILMFFGLVAYTLYEKLPSDSNTL